MPSRDTLIKWFARKFLLVSTPVCIIVVILFIFFCYQLAEVTLMSAMFSLPVCFNKAGIHNVTSLQHPGCCEGTGSKEFLETLREFRRTCDPSKTYDIRMLRSMTLGDILQHLISQEKEDEQLNSSPVQCPRIITEVDFKSRKVVLLSFPGSGNTWLRHVIQQFTGAATGSVYFDRELFSHGFPGEGKVKNTLVVKAHRIDRISRHFDYERIILLIRNPYDAMVADFMRGKLKVGHKGYAQIDKSDPAWRNAVSRRSLSWYRAVKTVLDSPLPTLVVFYEDLKTCLLTELLYLASFLEIDALSHFSFCCALREREGAFHRQEAHRPNIELFDVELQKVVNNIILHLIDDIRQGHPVVAARIKRYLVKYNIFSPSRVTSKRGGINVRFES